MTWVWHHQDLHSVIQSCWYGSGWCMRCMYCIPSSSLGLHIFLKNKDCDDGQLVLHNVCTVGQAQDKHFLAAVWILFFSFLLLWRHFICNIITSAQQDACLSLKSWESHENRLLALSPHVLSSSPLAPAGKKKNPGADHGGLLVRSYDWSDCYVCFHFETVTFGLMTMCIFFSLSPHKHFDSSAPSVWQTHFMDLHPYVVVVI